MGGYERPIALGKAFSKLCSEPKNLNPGCHDALLADLGRLSPLLPCIVETYPYAGSWLLKQAYSFGPFQLNAGWIQPWYNKLNATLERRLG